MSKQRRNQTQLAEATARYFDELPSAAATEEQELGQTLSTISAAIDFESAI
jgi:hypothetical protein